MKMPLGPGKRGRRWSNVRAQTKAVTMHQRRSYLSREWGNGMRMWEEGISEVHKVSKKRKVG